MKKMLVLLLLITSNLFGQGKDSLNELSPILITCVRADSKIPVTQKTYVESAIKSDYQGQEIPMLFKRLPSMYTNSDGGAANGYSYFALRGIDQTRINVTLNGAPLNEPEDMGVYTSNYPSFINAVQSMQIQRGVGTSSNGSSSFGGSINFQTKSGLNKGSEIQLGTGAFNTQRFNVNTSTGLSKDNLALFANIGGITTDGFRYNSGSHGGSIFLSGGYYGKGLINKLNFFNGISENKQAWEGATDAQLAKNYNYNPRGNDNMDHFNQMNIQWQTIATINPRVKFTTTLFYNHLKGNYEVYNIKDTTVNGYFAHENQHSDWVGYILQLDYRYKHFKAVTSLSENWYTRYHEGYEYYQDTTGYFNKHTYDNFGDKHDVSGFIKLSYEIHKALFYVDLQGRQVGFVYHGVTTIPDLTWSFFNPKAGVKFFLNSKTNLYYSFGVSHREPTRSVMFNGGMYAPTDAAGNAALNTTKPEQVIDNELGINYTGKKLKLQGNFYVMTFKDEIIPTGPIGLNSLPIMINVDKSIRYGVEVEVDYNIIDNLNYSLNVNLSNNEYELGSQHVHYLFNPNLILNHSISYMLGDISLGVNHTYISEAYIDIQNKHTLPIVSIFGLNIGYTYKRFNLTVQGNNLTGEKTYSNGYVKNDIQYRFGNALTNFNTTLKIKL